MDGDRRGGSTIRYQTTNRRSPYKLEDEEFIQGDVYMQYTDINVYIEITDIYCTYNVQQ